VGDGRHGTGHRRGRLHAQAGQPRSILFFANPIYLHRFPQTNIHHLLQCSEVVLALGSLLLPMQRFTDLRPFIASDDSDLKLLAEQARLKKPSTTSSSASNTGSIIIGVTDASVLALLDGCFEGAVFLSPISISNSGGDADFRGRGIRRCCCATIQ